MSTDTSSDTAAVEPDPAGTDEIAAPVTNVTPEPESVVVEPDADAPDGDGSEVDEGQDDDAGDGQGREAAKYRRRLRDAEAERDRLAEQVESLQRAEVERQATVGGLRPAALWASGAELDGLLGDDGTVDAAKVSAAIEGARDQLGIPAPPVGPRVPKEGRSPGRPPRQSGREAMIATVMGRDALDG
ncbi:hypothetical protein A5656_19675 [Mycobacterium gordonae]|nr:hypothetical protein [Mycobacterium gordonae]OBK56319.1 hypothetical protein A5656_19675 [Mycobacterium gordonae]